MDVGATRPILVIKFHLVLEDNVQNLNKAVFLVSNGVETAVVVVSSSPWGSVSYLPLVNFVDRYFSIVVHGILVYKRW